MANEALKAELKEKFKTGSMPSGESFNALIDALAEDGVDGKDGTNGTNGKDGADGFPSQSQWDSLVARVEALEPNE